MKMNVALFQHIHGLKTPNELPDKYYAAKQMLESTERRLSKDIYHAKTYNNQIADLVEREREELHEYCPRKK